MTAFPLAFGTAPLQRRRRFICIVAAVALVLSAPTLERRFIQPAISVVAAIAVVVSGLTVDSLRLPSPDPKLCDPPPFELPHVENPDAPAQLPSGLVIMQPATPSGFTLGCFDPSAGRAITRSK
jgi:hypothetical protein